jgi:transcriptional regulator with XRE-family HTH domain
LFYAIISISYRLILTHFTLKSRLNYGKLIKMNKTATEAQDRAERLKTARSMTGLSRREIEARFGINEDTLSGWERAIHGGLSAKGAGKIIEMLKACGIACSVEWLMFGIGLGPQLIEHMHSDKILIPTPAQEHHHIIEELNLFKKHYQSVFSFIINDDGLSPFYVPGDYVAGIPLSTHYKELNEKICIVQLNDGQILARRLTIGPENQTIILSCINPQTKVKTPIIYNAQLILAAPISWIRKPHSSM